MKKSDILNKDLWVILDALQNSIGITWKWVEGHENTQGNTEADKLAGQGVSETSTYRQDHAISFVTANASTAVSITTDEKVSTKAEEKVVCSFCSTDSSLKTINLVTAKVCVTMPTQGYHDISFMRYIIHIEHSPLNRVSLFPVRLPLTLQMT